MREHRLERIIEKLKREFEGVPTAADYVLALLYVAGGRLPRLKVQKGLFILSRAVSGLSEVLEFEAGWDLQI
ncbi:hypothetical protein, partial [Pyrobaculum sp.]|uniref:hypothetical protein n=1 Tax=Pyrobaculum sp. TaxID=2004705 RepID=UPI003D102903